MRGIFRQAAGQEHVRLREQLLARPGKLRHLPAEPATAADVAGVGALVRARLEERGTAAVLLDRPLESGEYLAFGATLGSPQPERALAVQEFVDEGVILNLITSIPATVDTDLQPFGANWLSLHTESSGAPPERQPRYVVLMCLTPGDHPGCAETVMVPMAGVLARLEGADREVLRHVRYAQGTPAPLLRCQRGREVFAVRDFQDDPLEWSYDGPATDPAVVDAALARLYAAMYGAEAYGVRWQQGLLVVIDNTVYFHARTAGVAAPPGTTRHLRRLRVAATA